MTLSPSILATLDDLADRHEELSALLGEAEIVSNRDKFTALSREYSELEPIIERYRRRQSSVEESLVEMYLAGVSVRRVEDITEALRGTKVRASAVVLVQPERENGLDRVS